MTEEKESLLAALAALTDGCGEELKLPRLLNALAALKQQMPAGAWVGVYLKKGDKLLLGPFQGTPACEVIALGQGVVGACFAQEKTLVVPDVKEFRGYICCDAAAAQEICVPLRINGETVGVFDVDYPEGGAIAADADIIEEAALLLAKLL